MASVVRVISRSAVIGAAIRAAGEQAIRDITNDALRQANTTVPLLEGTLMRSGAADVQVTATRITGSVSYDTPYAVKQHEDAELHHKPPRRDHWLLRTVQEQHADYTRHVVETLREATR